MSPSDEAVLRRWLDRRDARAFRIIVARHAGMVYTTCRRVLKNDADAEEVAQECFEALAEALGRESPRSLGPWLHGVAANKALMRARAEGRRRTLETAYASEQAAHIEPTWNDVYDMVDEAIAQLPEEIRAPLVLHYLCGQSHAQAARTTGVPRRTVSSRIQKGLELVASHLRARGVRGSSAALGAVVAAGLGEAAAVPASLTATLGRLALSQGVSAAPGMAGVFTAAKVAGAFAVAALLAGLCVVALKSTRGADVAKPVPVAETRTTESAPPQPATAAQQPTAPEPVAVTAPGATGNITGRVVDSAFTGEVWLALIEHMESGRNQPDTKALERRKPRPGVEVLLGEYAGEHWRRTLNSTRTDDSGTYSFDGVAPGHYGLRVVPPPNACPADDALLDKVKQVEVKPGETAEADFAVKDGIGVAGRVTDRAGAPVAGAEISAVPIVTVFTDQSYARIQENARLWTMTEDDGTYALNRVVPASVKNAAALLMTGQSAGGVVEVRARADGYSTARVFAHAVTQAMVKDAKMVLETYRRQGKLPIDDEQPPAAVPLPPMNGDRLTGLNLVLEPEATVSGMLVTTLGRPVANATLRLQFAEESPPTSRASDTYAQHDFEGENLVYFEGEPLKQYRVQPQPVQTNAEGRFAFDGLAAGTYTFEAETKEPWNKQQARNEPLNLSSGRHVADLDVIVEDPEDRIDLAGLVVDASTSQPLAEFTARVAEFVSTQEPTPLTGKFEKDAGQEGRFTIKGLSPGVVQIEVTADGYGPQRFRIDLADADRLITLALPPEAIVTGVVSMNGAPQSTQVSARNVEGWPEPFAPTDAATGEYVVKGLTPGEYRVSAYVGVEGPTSTSRAMYARISVAARQTARVDFPFTGSAVVQGYFGCPKGLLGVVHVLAGRVGPELPHDSDEYHEVFVGGAWDFRSSDHYVIPYLPAGHYTVIASINRKEPSGNVRLDVRVHEIDLHEEETVELDFDFTGYTSDSPSAGG